MFGIIGNAIGGIYQVMRGLKTVAQHTFRAPTTQEYPDVYPDLPALFRGRLALNVNPETGEHLCISCRQCERVCPDKCIEITAHKSPETNKLELIDFKIDHGLCMFCGLCTEVCPTDCIINTQDMEMADYTRSGLIYDLKKLTLSQDESAYYFQKKELALPKPKPAKPAPAAKPAEGAAAAAKPAAAAAKPAEGAAAKPAEGAAAKPAEGAAAKPAEGAAKSAEGAGEKSAEEAASKPAEAKSPEGKAGGEVGDLSSRSEESKDKNPEKE